MSFLLSVNLLIVILLSAIQLSFILPSDALLIISLLSIIQRSSILLNVVAPVLYQLPEESLAPKWRQASGSGPRNPQTCDGGPQPEPKVSSILYPMV